MSINSDEITKIDLELLEQKYKSKRKLSKVINKISKNYPVQYAIGNVDFLDTNLYVNKNVLIPRFETELLVHKLIKYIEKYDFTRDNYIDLCTGSGCIGISLKKKFENANVTLVDRSLKALFVSIINCKRNNVFAQIKCKNILKKYNYNKKFSILVSNPPYVKLGSFVTPNTKYEPKIALYPGENDILFYEKILDYSKKILYPKNIIAFEIGENQSTRICKKIKEIFPNCIIKVEKDFNNLERFIFVFNNCE